MTAPRACVGIRPRVWVALILAGLTSWAVLAVAELAGRDLACWCPEGGPCHGDDLLIAANGAPA